MGFFKNEIETRDRFSGDTVYKEEWSDTSLTLGAIGLVFLVLCLLIAGCGAVKGLESPEAGKIGVVRNGGPIDKKDIREVLPPASGLSFVGLFSNTHYYPSNQRNYIIAANGQDTPGADEFKTPTKDSVNVGVDAQVYFTLNTDIPSLKEFDTRYGTRTNPGDDGKGYFPYEGEDGWRAFLRSFFATVIHNALREEVAQFNCTELNAQCALLKTTADVKVVDGAATNVNFTKIQDALKESLTTDLQKTLGGDYFEIQKVILTGIKLPDESQKAVDEANAAKAQVSTEKQKALQATYKAKATLAQARANRANPWAGLTEALKQCGQACVLNVGGGGDGLNLGFNK